jgi:hypothetical protein
MFAIEKLRNIERKRAAVATKLAHANDNRRVVRQAPATPGRAALVGRWRKNDQTGRLEWNWSLEAVSGELDAPLLPSPALRAGHTGNVLNAMSEAYRPDCHPTDTQLAVVRSSARATLIFARN